MGRVSASGVVARMKRLSRILPHGGRAIRPVGRRRVMRKTLYAALGLALVVVLPVGLAYVRLSTGPVSFDGLADRAAEAIAARIGERWRVSVAGSAIELKDGWLALRATGLDIRNQEGVLVVRAPDAIVSVDTASLMTGVFVAKAIEFRDLQLDASLDRTGALTLVPAGEAVEGETAAAPRPGPPAEAPMGSPSPGLPPDGSPQPSPVSKAVASLFDLVLEPTGIIGAIDRAKLTNARLRIVDQNRQERAAFRNVSATFERYAPDRRRFDLRLDGSAGGWRLQGDVTVQDGGRREGTVTATDVPIQDVLLFAGMSGLPVATDARLTGQLEAALVGGRLARLDARLGSSSGSIRIDDEDMPPVGLEAASVEGSWNEEQRSLALKNLTFRNRDTLIGLAGTLNAPAGQPWRLDLSGRNAVLGTTEPGDPAVAIETIAAAIVEQDGGIGLEKLELHGPTLNATMNGTYGTARDAKALEVNIFAEGTKVRSFLRLWPNLAVTKVRRYLAANLRAGTIETLGVSVAMSGEDLASAFSRQPIPDGSVRVDFAIADATLHINEGLPSLSRLGVAGSVTGTRAEVRAETGAIAFPDGRTLAVTNGRLSLPQIWSANADARIEFRLDGGADGVAALLRAPALREVTGELEFDPAQIRGQADLSVSLDLPIKNTPALAELPVTVNGTITGVGIDKAFGKERLENGQLSVSYTGGNLAIRGEGRFGGIPTIIDIRQPRNLPGEATISFSLDEAARARKGITLGTGLSGALAVRVSAPLGKAAKGGAKVEVDLTRATINNLLPGWTKPPGRPGKLSFVAQGGGADIRDLVLDSGPVQMRGSATVSSEGQIDRAELTTFKLSPGDDMRVQLDRSGSVYRATIRGNLADARPLIRQFTNPPAAGGPREGREVDIDLGVNILTGFNDEALTNATVKAGLRGKDLRQFQLGGKFRSAAVSAQLGRAERGPPSLAVQSRDAGATLRFLDIYRRMTGGELSFQISMGDGPQRGAVTMSSFALRNEPALRRIVAHQPQAMAEDRVANALTSPVDANEVLFTTLKAEFSRTASRLEFRDAVLFGNQVGFTLGGWIDYAKSLTDIAGTFVPAYGLNNAFAQVPLFGPILGGGQNEGLFAVSFRVSGSAASPTLTVNPLSAVAPGFLRKILGAIGAAADDVAGAAGSPGSASQPKPDR